MQKALLMPIRHDLLREAERLRERLATIDTAIRGLDAAIGLDFGDTAAQAPESDGGTAQRSTIKDAVRQEAVKLPGIITAPELYADLLTREPFASDRRLTKPMVSHALREGLETGDLRLVEKGAGRRSARYKSARVGLDLGGELKTGAEISVEVPAP